MSSPSKDKGMRKRTLPDDFKPIKQRSGQDFQFRKPLTSGFRVTRKQLTSGKIQKQLTSSKTHKRQFRGQGRTKPMLMCERIRQWNSEEVVLESDEGVILPTKLAAVITDDLKSVLNLHLDEREGTSVVKGRKDIVIGMMTAVTKLVQEELEIARRDSSVLAESWIANSFP